MKRYVKVQQNVPTVWKATMLTPKGCKKWHKKRNTKNKLGRNVSFPEAWIIVKSPTPVPCSSYDSIIKAATKHVSFTDATTQTDPVIILESEESYEKQMSDSNNVTKPTTTQTKNNYRGRKDKTSIVS